MGNVAGATSSSAAPVDLPKHTINEEFRSSHQGWVTPRRLGEVSGSETSLYSRAEEGRSRHYLQPLFRAVQSSWS